jgi:hypothetical protein
MSEEIATEIARLEARRAELQRQQAETIARLREEQEAPVQVLEQQLEPAKKAASVARHRLAEAFSETEQLRLRFGTSGALAISALWLFTITLTLITSWLLAEQKAAWWWWPLPIVPGAFLAGHLVRSFRE